VDERAQQDEAPSLSNLGMKPSVSVFTALRYLRRSAAGEWSYGELGEKVHLVEGRVEAVMYLGCAVKSVRLGSDES
jgi:hypothetical protein